MKTALDVVSKMESLKASTWYWIKLKRNRLSLVLTEEWCTAAVCRKQKTAYPSEFTFSSDPEWRRDFHIFEVKYLAEYQFLVY